MIFMFFLFRLLNCSMGGIVDFPRLDSTSEAELLKDTKVTYFVSCVLNHKIRFRRLSCSREMRILLGLMNMMKAFSWQMVVVMVMLLLEKKIFHAVNFFSMVKAFHDVELWGEILWENFPKFA